MKNIHVLPTDKPSRLCLDSKDKLWFAPNSGYTIADEKQHIYITSDEEIKEGDWFHIPNQFIGFEHISKEFDNSLDSLNAKKIILTTDQDLIKDGVQAIDDEFLEWFVKNPSCEWIEVEKYNGFKTKKAGESWLFENDKYNWKGDSLDYKIIIPKEEPKQENCCTPVGHIKRYKDCIGCDRKPKLHSFCETPEEKCTMNYCDENGCQNRKRELVESKQETLEYELLQHIKMCLECNNKSQAIRLLEKYGFEKQQKGYSEEEAYKIWKAGQEYWRTSGDSITFEELTEQFKTKYPVKTKDRILSETSEETKQKARDYGNSLVEGTFEKFKNK